MKEMKSRDFFKGMVTLSAVILMVAGVVFSADDLPSSKSEKMPPEPGPEHAAEPPEPKQDLQDLPVKDSMSHLIPPPAPSLTPKAVPAEEHGGSKPVATTPFSDKLEDETATPSPKFKYEPSPFYKWEKKKERK